MRTSKKTDWPDKMLHGTSLREFMRLCRSRSTKGLWLTDDENTACDYAQNQALRDGSVPVIVRLDSKAVRGVVGGKGRYETDDEGDVVPEEFVYFGPLVPRMFVDIEVLEDEVPVRGIVTAVVDHAIDVVPDLVEKGREAERQRIATWLLGEATKAVKAGNASHEVIYLLAKRVKSNAIEMAEGGVS